MAYPNLRQINEPLTADADRDGRQLTGLLGTVSNPTPPAPAPANTNNPSGVQTLAGGTTTTPNAPAPAPTGNTPAPAAPAPPVPTNGAPTPQQPQTTAAPATAPNSAPAPFVSPAGAAPTPANASVVDQLNGLLASNSPYMQAARQAGLRAANRRGLLNTSMAAGSSEAAAIAAAAPIASQEASQIHQRNQTELEGWTALRNSTTLQDQSDRAAFERLNTELANRIQLQGMGDAAAMQRLIAQGDIEQALQVMRNDNAITQTQINANVSLLNGYMSAFATLAQNPELPSSARNSYMQEFIRVTTMGQSLVNALSGTTVTWPTSGT